MPVLFCPHCGTLRVSDEDLYCRNCGNRYSKLASESPLPSQPEELPPIAKTWTAEPTEIDHDKTAKTNDTSELKTNWLDFWIYVKLPLSVLSLLYELIQTKSSDLFLGELIVALPLAWLLIATLLGLRRRRLSAWQSNWIVLALECLFYPFTRTYTGTQEDRILATVFTFFIYCLVWGLPNYVYFSKRRQLFSGPPLVEGGIRGFLSAIRQFLWPSLGNTEQAKKACREGFFAAVIVASLTTLVAISGALGFNLWSLVDAGIFAVLAWGIYKLSRTATLAGIVFFLIEKANDFMNGTLTFGSALTAGVLLLMFTNGARGAVAYHRIQKGSAIDKGVPSPAYEGRRKLYFAVLASFVFGVLALRVYQILTSPAGVAQSNVGEDDLPALVKRVQPAVVTITAYDSKGTAIGQGSGFFVSEHGEILTNHHVLEGAASAEAKMSDGSKDPIDAVLADDPDSDLTKVMVIEDDKTPFLQLSQEPAEVGERIAVIGSPLGLEHTVSEGIVSAIPEERQEVEEAMPATLQITAPISEGSSGSPVIDMRGNVLGVATAYFQKGQALNFAIPLERILILKRLKPVSLAIWNNPRRKPTVLDLFDQGLASMQLHDYEQALLSFDLAIKKKPDFALAWWGAGVCLVVRKETDEGIEALKKASQLDPSLAQPHYSLGITYAQQGLRGPAYDQYEALKPLDPELAKTLKEQLPK